MAAAASKSWLWGSAAWWFVAVVSVPFSIYTVPFAINAFDTYRTMSLNFEAKNFDIAGLHVRDHHITWQTHSVAALVFISTGLFQFAPRFRKAYPVIHRRMGYAYSGAALVQAFTGLGLMIPVCEFGTVGRFFFFLTGVYLLVSTVLAVIKAREKKFKEHQRWMIRSASMGYSVIGVRIWITIFLSSGMYVWHASELGAASAFTSFAIPAEIYIRTYLSNAKKKAQ